MINYSSDSSAADELVKAIGSDRVLAVKADAGKISEIEKLVDQAVERFGKIDILIPNAAVLPMKDLASTTEEDFDGAYTLNVKGPYFLVQVSLHYIIMAHRLRSGQGQQIKIADIFAAESRTTYGFWLSCRAHINKPMRSVSGGAELSSLRIYQRCY